MKNDISAGELLRCRLNEEAFLAIHLSPRRVLQQKSISTNSALPEVYRIGTPHPQANSFADGEIYLVCELTQKRNVSGGVNQ
uniref:AlNc14C105G6172 protein n=1 Tax=Albugo laibachii Nc14 TaxID=890382 RepID=F0WHW6_9STRA|nr:AlNc14C105G6172 [Albugo laibachii Nc14]|eukprot:CCA20842.1 AlNc14C105G6172 [Albugo laibachii Nc14]